jgi:hypothetical protein
VRIRRVFVVLSATAAILLAAPAAAFADQSVHVQLNPLNHSGATGTATLTAMDNGDLKVDIRANGLVPNAAHVQMLHGSTAGMDFHCPDMSADTNHNGYLTTEEGMPVYGNIFIALTTRGDTAPSSGLAMDRMPRADAQGDLSYDRTIPAADLPPGTLAHLWDLHIVQHGIDANNDGKYDVGTLGESTLAAAANLHGVPEEATDPADCGMVAGAAAGAVPAGGVATGDGSTRNIGRNYLYGLGALALMAALGVFLAGRRRAFATPRQLRGRN